MLLSCWLEAHRVKLFNAVSTKSKQRHKNREQHFGRPPHTNSLLLEVTQTPLVHNRQSLSMWRSLLSLLRQLQVTCGKETDLQYVPLRFGLWSRHCTLRSWSLTSSSATAQEGAESIPVFSSFPPLPGEGAGSVMAVCPPVSWKMQVQSFSVWLLPRYPGPSRGTHKHWKQYPFAVHS